MATLIRDAGRRDEAIERLQQQCLDKLVSLNMSIPADTRTFCERLGEQWRRTIHLMPVNLRISHSCAVWVATSAEDFIFYEAATSKVHQEHIIAHELAHMICGHQSNELGDIDALRLFPDVDPELVRDMLSRTRYADAIEQEAEMMAYLIRAAMAGLIVLPPHGMLDALEIAMGYRYRI